MPNCILNNMITEQQVIMCWNNKTLGAVLFKTQNIQYLCISRGKYVNYNKFCLHVDRSMMFLLDNSPVLWELLIIWSYTIPGNSHLFCSPQFLISDHLQSVLSRTFTIHPSSTFYAVPQKFPNWSRAFLKSRILSVF